ncbi:YceD family protein [Candidatus Thiothrix anitrata]|uniref:YceD family protein n=1 Tax=Candidatus Thiothrix anitrata TaxID=2823902 RepID=UPI001D18FC71|nr:YceD family protein [Candidatus Thiothrix anitrata]
MAGVMPLQQLPRLVDVVLAGSQDVAVTLDFTRSVGGRPMIKGHIRGNVVLECQRCMQPVTIPLDVPVEVALTTFESDERPEQEGLEAWLIEDERLFIQDFVEDEILLALPLAAKHEQCEPVRKLIEALPSDVVLTESGQGDSAVITKKNPFAVLKDWKKTE